MPFDYSYVLPPTGQAENAQVREMFDDVKAYVNTLISGGGSSGAPSTSQFVTLATDAALANERVLTAGTAISLTDGGAGSTITIANTGVTSNIAGTGISVSGATGAVTITNAGVISATGTSNQVNVSASTGAVTFSLPQSIATTSDPTFRYLTVDHGTVTDSGLHFTPLTAPHDRVFGWWVKSVGTNDASLDLRIDGTDYLTIQAALMQFSNTILAGQLSSSTYNVTNAGTITITAQANSGYSLALPSAGGSAGETMITDGSGNLSWDLRATAELDNLTTTSINASLIPDIPSVHDIGNTTLPWAAVIANSFLVMQASPGVWTTSFSASASQSGYITYILPPNDGSSNQVLTTDGSGVLTWGPGTGAGAATQALDNLASVAINTTLVSDTNNTDDLGSSSITWKRLYLKTGLIIQESGAGTDAVTIQSPAALAASYTLTLPTTDGNSGEILSTDGSGVLSWTSTLTGAATIALDNLASTAVNVDLSPDSDNAWNLGAISARWKTVYSVNEETDTVRVSSTVIFEETGGGTDSMQIGAPSNITTSYTLKWPVAQGGASECLINDGSGNLSWATPGSITGTVNSGSAGRLSLYPSSGALVDDVYVQNTKNIDIVIATQASRSANLEITIPNPGDAVTTANVAMDQGSYTIAGGWTFSAGVSFPAGSISTAAIQLNDVNTGFYTTAAGTIDFTCNGNHPFFVDANGIHLVSGFDMLMGGTCTIQNSDGSVTAPSYTFGASGQQDNGIYRIGTDTWGLAAAGTKALGITSTGLNLSTNATGDSNFGTISSVTLAHYYEGTFTGTFTGPFTSGTITFTYRRIGKIVILSWGTFSGTSSAAAPFTASTVIPSNLRPAATVSFPTGVKDNGTALTAPGWISIGTNGTITISISNAADNFTNTGTAGLTQSPSVCYNV